MSRADTKLLKNAMIHTHILARLSVVLILAQLAVFAQTPVLNELKVGDMAPDFKLPYATKDSVASEEVSLSQFAGKSNVVLAFYPADWSGGCTKEVCALRDNVAQLATLNAEILAISGDYPYSHYEWAKFHHLPFKLVSDHSHAVAALYGSYTESTGYNKRTVFIIDKRGRIAYVDLRYSVRDLESFTRLHNALKTLQ